MPITPATPSQEAAYHTDIKAVNRNRAQAYKAFAAQQRALRYDNPAAYKAGKAQWKLDRKAVGATPDAILGRNTGKGLRSSNRTKYGYASQTANPGTPVAQAGAAYRSAQQFQPPSAEEQRRWGKSIGGTGRYAARPLGAPPPPTRTSVWDNGWVEAPGNSIWNRRIGSSSSTPLTRGRGGR